VVLEVAGQEMAGISPEVLETHRLSLHHKEAMAVQEKRPHQITVLEAVAAQAQLAQTQQVPLEETAALVQHQPFQAPQQLTLVVVVVQQVPEEPLELGVLVVVVMVQLGAVRL
jgi:hypothetical protein